MSPLRPDERPKQTEGGVQLALSIADQREKEGDGSLQEGVGDLLQAAAYSAVRKPLDGAAQVLQQADVDVKAPDVFDKPDRDNAWTSAGTFAGSVLDYYALSKTVGKAFDITGFRNSNLLLTGMEQATAGAIYEGLMPVAGKGDFWDEKRDSMLLGGVTFGAMGTASAALDRYGTKLFGDAASRTFAADVGIGATSGFAGGTANYLTNSWLTGEPLNYYDGARTIGSWSVFGGAVHGLDHAGTNVVGQFKEILNSRRESGDPLMSLGQYGIYDKRPIGEMKQRVEDMSAENELLRHKAFNDDLTGLRNKAAGQEALKQEIERARRENDPLSAIVMDLDGFKAVNDTFNHQMGDEALRTVGRLMRENFDRGTDVLIRNGGDEFVVLLPNTPLADAQRLAVKIQDALRLAVNEKQVRVLQPSETHQASEKPVGVSVGTVEWKRNETPEDFLTRGDELAYSDKQARKRAGLAKDRGE